jgi:hypothetical protein
LLHNQFLSGCLFFLNNLFNRFFQPGPGHADQMAASLAFYSHITAGSLNLPEPAPAGVALFQAQGFSSTELV